MSCTDYARATLEAAHRGSMASTLYTVRRAYPDGSSDVWRHRTLKAAFRRLGSVICGKLAKRGEPVGTAYGIITPRLEVLSWTDARNLIEHGAL